MDLKVTQENLNKALNNVARIASSRTTLPILNNILIQAQNNRLKIAATNLDIAISQHVGTKIEKEGSLTIPARLFHDYINNMPTSTISLKQDGNKLHINTNNYKSTINGTPIDDYPVMPAISEGSSFVIPAQAFKKSLQQVLFAASSDEARPVLTAVYLHTINGVLFIAATDSYRLAEKQIQDVKNEVSLLIPVSAIVDLVRVISDQAQDIDISYDGQQVCFALESIELITRLIDGNYPDYKKLIPTTFKNTAKVKKTDLIAVTKVAGLFSRENAGSITVTLNEEENSLYVDAIASQVGENSSKVEGVINGSESITLNSRYLLDGLQAISSDEITFNFNGKLEPIVLKDEKDSSYTHVIMPLKS